MGNIRKRINVRLVNKAEHLLKYISKSTYNTDEIFGKDYDAIHEISKSIYVGFTILNLSKCMTFITILLKIIFILNVVY